MGVKMKLIDNLFGEFIDCMMGIDPLTNPETQYTLIGGVTQLGSGFLSVSFVQV